MFDLEKSIADWRKQMLAAGIKSPVPLDELEVHVREEIERQVKSGIDTQRAFEIATRNLGQVQVLKKEFKSIAPRKNSLATAAATLVLGLTFAGSGISSWYTHKILAVGSGLEILGGGILFISAAHDMIRVVKSHRHSKISLG